MKLICCLALFVAFTALAAEVETTEVTHGHYQGKGHGVFAVPMEKLVSVITDYTNACQTSSCHYNVPNVEETRIFPGESNDQFYTWTKIKSVKSGSYFSQVRIERSSQEVTITNSMVPEKLGKELSTKYNLPNQPLMDTTVSTWILSSSGETTEAVIKIETTSSSFIITRFPAQVLKNLKETIEALLANLTK